MSQKSPAQPSVWHFDGGGVGFHFTIRRADAVDTGLDVVPNENSVRVGPKATGGPAGTGQVADKAGGRTGKPVDKIDV